jgi:hypothetical protein
MNEEGSTNLTLKKREGKPATIHKAYFIVSIEMNNQKHVYLGGELWGIMRGENGEMGLGGSPETSDNYLILCFAAMNW